MEPVHLSLKPLNQRMEIVSLRLKSVPTRLILSIGRLTPLLLRTKQGSASLISVPLGMELGIERTKPVPPRLQLIGVRLQLTRLCLLEFLQPMHHSLIVKVARTKAVDPRMQQRTND